MDKYRKFIMEYNEILRKYKEYKQKRCGDSSITNAERRLLLKKVYRKREESINNNKKMDNIIQKYFDS